MVDQASGRSETHQIVHTIVLCRGSSSAYEDAANIWIAGRAVKTSFQNHGGVPVCDHAASQVQQVSLSPGCAQRVLPESRLARPIGRRDLHTRLRLARSLRQHPTAIRRST